MKTILAFALASISALCFVPAKAASIIWHGSAYISSATGTCNGYNPTNTIYAVRFQPQLLGDNGPNSRMAWFANDYAMSFETNNAAFGTTAQPVKYFTIWTGLAQSISPQVSVTFTSQLPPTLTTAQAFIRINGQIDNFDFMPGCSVIFKMAVERTLEGGG